MLASPLKVKMLSYLLLLYLCCMCFTNAFIKNFDLTEGSYCTVESFNGTCVPFQRCLDGTRLLKIGQRPKICSFDGKTPIICCTDCEHINPNTVIFNKDGEFYYKKGQKAYDKCLEYLVTLPYPCQPQPKAYLREWISFSQCHEYSGPFTISAVGGDDAKRDQFPHMALLGYGSDEESVQWVCGGSVISEKHILTAAHCISNTLGPVSFAALGLLKRTDPQKLWQIYKVKRIIPHPEYKSPHKYHDIALIETVERIEFSPSVLPACLNPGNVNENNAYATGWGALGSHRQLADTLQTVNLTRFEKEECSRQYPSHRLLLNGYDHKTQMCYGDTGAVKDTCEGDSGGPLQVTSEFSNCMHVILGVTSYGRSCGFIGNAGMYTRVEHYLPWIEGIVWP